MALTGKTISQLPELTAITPNTLFVVEQLGNTYNIKNLLFQNAYFPLSGGTVTGSTNFTGGLSVNTISATTYQNLPTFSGGSVTGLTVNGNLTVTGNTSAQGFTATTISATTYQNLPTDIRTTGGTYSNNTFTFTNNTGGTYSVLFNSVTGLTVNGELTVTGNTSLKGLTATTVSASTYTNVPVVTGGTYTSGTITFNNATGGTFNVTGLPVGGQGGQLYYFNTSVTQTPYKEFGTTGTTASEQLTTISVASGITSTIESYLTPSGYPNSLILPGGVWSFYLHSYKEDSSSSFDLYCDVYKRTSGGVETYLFSTEPFEVTSTGLTSTLGLSNDYYSGMTLNVSDRILVLVRATNTGTSTKQITFITEGSTRYSYGITTFNGIPANVSSLTTGTGLSGNSTTGAVTLVNTAPDQTVTISGGTGITTGGTYPNFTLVNSAPDQTVTITGGTNIQIAGTYPNFGVDFTGQTSFPYLPLSGGTITGNLTITGDTSVQGLTATTLSASTVTVGNTSGTPNQAASFDSTGKLVAGLGQTTFTAFGSATLSVTSSVTTFTVLPGITQTITVPENCKVLITANGGINTTSTVTTSIAVVDIAIFIDGAYPTNGGYIKIGAHNPSATAVNNTGLPWSITTIQNLSAGSHTIDVRAIYSNGSTSSVSGNNTTARQGGLYITIIKN